MLKVKFERSYEIIRRTLPDGLPRYKEFFPKLSLTYNFHNFVSLGNLFAFSVSGRIHPPLPNPRHPMARYENGDINFLAWPSAAVYAYSVLVIEFPSASRPADTRRTVQPLAHDSITDNFFPNFYFFFPKLFALTLFPRTDDIYIYIHVYVYAYFFSLNFSIIPGELSSSLGESIKAVAGECSENIWYGERARYAAAGGAAKVQKRSITY